MLFSELVFATVIVAVLVLNQPVAAQYNIEITSLGTLGGNSEGLGINNLGHIVGDSSYQSPGGSWAYVWTPEDGMVGLGFPGVAWDINDLGQIVGYSGDETFLWTAEDGKVNLGINGVNSRAYGINNQGRIVGRGSWPTGAGAFLWEDGTITSLGFGEAHDINDLGHVVGYTLWENGYLWTPEDGLITIEKLPGAGTVRPRSINNIGQVVGDYHILGTSNWHAFLWTVEDGMMDLGTLGGDESWAWDINDNGQIVGAGNTASDDWYGFLWEEGTFTTLPHYSDVTTQCDAVAINDLGQIAGVNFEPAGRNFGVLWTISTPTPEEMLRALRGEIERLVAEGELSEGHGNALLAKVGAAELQLEKGNLDAALHILEAFINQVNALDKAGKISPEGAVTLINLANDAIAGLKSSQT